MNCGVDRGQQVFGVGSDSSHPFYPDPALPVDCPAAANSASFSSRITLAVCALPRGGSKDRAAPLHMNTVANN